MRSLLHLPLAAALAACSSAPATAPGVGGDHRGESAADTQRLTALLKADMHERGQAKMNRIDLDEERKGDVVADQLEVLVIEQRLYVPARAGKEVVDTKDLRSLSDQTRTKMGAEKARPAGDQNTLFEMHSRYFAVRGHYHSRAPDPDLRSRLAS